MMIQLRQEQRFALPVLEWLCSDEERDNSSGRTLLLAIVAIRKALRNPGYYVEVIDHVRPSIGRILGKNKAFEAVKKLLTLAEMPGVTIHDTPAQQAFAIDPLRNSSMQATESFERCARLFLDL